MVNWLKMLNPKSQRDAERAFWAVMFLPEFARRIRWNLLNSAEPVSNSTVVQLSQEAARRVAMENFSSDGKFLSEVELANASLNLDYSARTIANDVCRSFDAGLIARKGKSSIDQSPFDNLIQEIFLINANNAIEGARIGHLKYNAKGVRHIVDCQQININLGKSSF